MQNNANTTNNYQYPYQYSKYNQRYQVDAYESPAHRLLWNDKNRVISYSKCGIYLLLACIPCLLLTYLITNSFHLIIAAAGLFITYALYVIAIIVLLWDIWISHEYNRDKKDIALINNRKNNQTKYKGMTFNDSETR